jgi:hypothetical protein
MKRIILAIALIMTIGMTSFANHIVAKGKSHSAFGNYKIERLTDHLVYNNKELDKYLITYEKSDVKVLVAVDRQSKCKKYYVLSEQIPVQYEFNGAYFGIKKLDKALLSKDFDASSDKLNKKEFYSQRVITSEMTVMKEHLNLIASYYPGLYNEKAS